MLCDVCNGPAPRGRRRCDECARIVGRSGERCRVCWAIIGTADGCPTVGDHGEAGRLVGELVDRHLGYREAAALVAEDPHDGKTAVHRALAARVTAAEAAELAALVDREAVAL